MFRPDAAVGGPSAALARTDLAQASTLNTIVRQTGGALAPAVVTTALVLSTPAGAAVEPPVSAYQHAYLALAAIAALTAVFSFTGFLRGCPGLQAGEESDSCGAGQGQPDRRQGDPASTPHGRDAAHNGQELSTVSPPR
ncbi:hypothetical protein [Streptomyces sp. CA-106131]|uniref:hypothetical protein n=1 Tax=Streptomyces sp. CA-106131 TaxID=3240045 RepID=UPI003D925E0A